MKKLFFIILALLLMTVTQGAWAQTLPTDGTGAYLISSVDDWNTFCEDVTGGITYSGKFVKLTSNISVSTKAGGNFSGTFDGDGHTITANISGTGSMALFHTLNGGTIKNLTVAGSISGNMHTAALLVSLGNGGTNIIENCVVTADVTCSSSHMGGFLAHGNSSNITIRGCVFKGKMTGGGTAKGVFYGWGDNGGTGSVTDCLYIMASGQDTDGLDLTKGSGIVTVTNCYKTASAGSQGTQAYASSNAPATLGSLVQDYGVVKAYQNSLLYDGKYYVAQTAVLNITSPSVGQVIGSDGKNYNYANLPSGVTPVAKIFYLEENRGLALAMSDESGTMQQAPAMTTCASHKAPFAGGTWKLASKDEWETMISAAGEYHNLRDGFAGVGGTNMHAGIYWSSTYMYFFNLGLNYWWDNHRMIYDGQGNFYVRACLEFSLLPIVEIEIGSTDDWNTFVENVNNGDSYINKHVKLTNDISVSTPVGSRADENSNRPFRGTFDGGGHTITVTFADDGNSGMAPFRYIDGATIKNLKVAGTIASSQQHTSGVVGYASGNNLIEDCVVTATLNISSDYAGGIVGHGLNSSTTIRGCAFTGTINGVDGNRGNVGGIWGWSDNATPTLVNCLEAGTYTNIASMHPMGLQSTSGTIADSYYLNVQMGEPRNACTVRGAKRAEAHATAPDDLGDMLVDYGMVQAYANGILFGGTYYVVYDLSGTGTENDPYIIANTDDWNMFATNVNDGDDYSGQFVKLTADISGITTMVGNSENNSFQGTFDGGSHTLTFTIGTSESAFNEQYCALFRYVKNATIQNLKVAGNIYTAQQFAAGLVARPYGSINITDCQVSTVIYSSVNGDGTHGGLVVRLEYATGITITGCVFTGRLLTNNGTNNCGGFIGWGDNKSVNISNSLYAPDSSIPEGWTAINHEKTFVRGANPTLTDCYFTEAMGDAQGAQAYTVLPDNEICKVLTFSSITVYLTPVCTVTGVEDSYLLSGNPSITPVVTFNETPLTFGTDYTATLDGENVATFPVSPDEMGTYTLILTGAGDYAGAKTFEFMLLPAPNEDITFTDANTYTLKTDVNVASATYTKTLGSDRVGKHQAWFVPFDYTITSADLEKFDFYKINMIANAPDPSQNATDDIWVFLKKLDANDVLHANMPYVYKPKQAVDNYEFVTQNAVLKTKNTGVVGTMQTMEDIYTLYGTYEPTTATAEDPFYYVNINGGISLGNNGSVTVGAFRWIMRQESKFGGSTPVAYAREIHFFDGEDAETTGIVSLTPDPSPKGEGSGYYTLDGRKLNGKPTAKGVYVYNGRKVVIK